MFQTVFPSIIRSSKLHIQHQAFVRQLQLPAASLDASCWLYSENILVMHGPMNVKFNVNGFTQYEYVKVWANDCAFFFVSIDGIHPQILDSPSENRTAVHGLLLCLMTPVRQFIYHLTDKFFVSCPTHPNPLIRNTGNYTLEDLHRQYTKYRHKRIKHILF